MDEVIADQPPDRQIHVVLDNLTTHKKNDDWLAPIRWSCHPGARLWRITRGHHPASQSMDIVDGSNGPSVAELLQEIEASTQRAAGPYARIRSFTVP